MKYYIIDLASGYREILSENELIQEFTMQEIDNIKQDTESTFKLTKYTTRQVNRCKRLKSDNDFIYDIECEYNYTPSVIDLLEHYYN